LSLVFLIFLVYSGGAFAALMIPGASSVDFMNPAADGGGIGATLYWTESDGDWEIQLHNVDFLSGDKITRLIIPIGDPTPPAFFTVDESTSTTITSDTALWQTGAYDVKYAVGNDISGHEGTWVAEFTFGPYGLTQSFPVPMYGPAGLTTDEWSPVISWSTSFTTSTGLLTLYDGGGTLNVNSDAPVGDSDSSGGNGVPEPSTLLLLGLGMLGLGLNRKMRTGKVSKNT